MTVYFRQQPEPQGLQDLPSACSGLHHWTRTMPHIPRRPGRYSVAWRPASYTKRDPVMAGVRAACQRAIINPDAVYGSYAEAKGGADDFVTICL